MSNYVDHVIQTCPRCGVEYKIFKQSIKKRIERGTFEDWNTQICKDCKPQWVRKTRVTPEQIWEAYKKDKGIK